MREGFYIGPFLVHYYGMIIMAGVVAAAWLTTKLVGKFGENPEITWDILPWVLLAGVVGARIWHILTPTDSLIKMGITTQYYLTHPLDAIMIWRGGLGIPGAIIGGALAVWVLSRKMNFKFWFWTDAVAPGLALAQAIGRWGNFVNQEVYGMPSTLPWAIYIDPAHRLPEFADQATYHPLFLYESLLNLLIMGILLFGIFRLSRFLKQGYIFQTYLVLYPTVRFFLEFLRLDASSVGGINANQALMGLIALSSLVILVVRIIRDRGKTPDAQSENDFLTSDAEVQPLQDSSDNISGENEKE